MTFRKYIAAVLIFCILCNSTIIVFSQEVTPDPNPTPTEIFESPTPNPTPTDELTPSATQTPTPIEEITITPTPTETLVNEPGVDVQMIENTTTVSTDSAYLVNPDTGVTIYNSGDGLVATASSTVNAEVTVTNNNDIEVNKTVDDVNDTGNNTATDNININGGETVVQTGPATSVQNLLSVVNTNILASSADAVLINIFDPNYQPIDLSQTSSCNAEKMLNTPEVLNIVNTGNNVQIISDDAYNQSTQVDNNNRAIVNNTVDVSANTGNNNVTENIGSGTRVETGDASIGLNLLTMANTNLVGNCWYYGVVNLFGDQTGDIFLPNDQQILGDSTSPGFIIGRNQTDITNTGNDATISANLTTNYNTTISNINNATVSTVVNTNATTGNNTINDGISFDNGPTITTGNATSIINILDLINTNIVGNKFFALKINKFGNWLGTIRGWMGQFIELPDSIILYTGKFPVPSPTPEIAPDTAADIVNTGDATTIDQSNAINNSIAVNNNNLADVNNVINLNANTGNNQAGKFNAHITTGNASIKANILNMINTNIIGDNWFYGVVNIFGNFVGDIVFPRPDLTVTTSTDRSSVQNGDTVTFTNHIGNIGLYRADSVKVTNTIPNNAVFVSASNGSVINGSAVSWDLGTLAKSQAKEVSITVRFGSNALLNELLHNICAAKTITPEPNINNNQGSFVLSFFIPQPLPSQKSNNSGSNNSSGGSGNSSANTSSAQSTSSPVSAAPQQSLYQWIPYTTYYYKYYRYYNKKTKKWEKRWIKVPKVVYKKVFKKVVKITTPPSKIVKKTVKNTVKKMATTKYKAPKPQLNTFINFYSTLVAKIRK